VLHDLSLQIRSGERVGIGTYHVQNSELVFIDAFTIVGRTGSGKVRHTHDRTKSNDRYRALWLWHFFAAFRLKAMFTSTAFPPTR